jgi:hypothetical protein
MVVQLQRRKRSDQTATKQICALVCATSGADIDEQKTATRGRNYTHIIQSHFGLLKAFYIMIYLQKALTHKHVARVFRVIRQPLSQCLLGFRATLEGIGLSV